MLLACASLVLAVLPASAGPRPASPFARTLSNTAPLAFGMTIAQVAQSLGVPLYRVERRSGGEVMLAVREAGGSALWPRRERLYLQFRRGRLSGWKGDWGAPWMWR